MFGERRRDRNCKWFVEAALEILDAKNSKQQRLNLRHRFDLA